MPSQQILQPLPPPFTIKVRRFGLVTYGWELKVILGVLGRSATNLYTSFLSKGLSFAEAACEASKGLRQENYRKGRYGMEVKLQDRMVLVVYSTVDSDTLALAVNRVVSVGEDRNFTEKSEGF